MTSSDPTRVGDEADGAAPAGTEEHSAEAPAAAAAAAAAAATVGATTAQSDTVAPPGPASASGEQDATASTVAQALHGQSGSASPSQPEFFAKQQDEQGSATPEPRDELVAAESADDDADSALGEDDASITESLRSSILQHRTENGRTYHSYRESVGYVLPNDESEQERLDLQHHLFNLTLEGRLFMCPAGYQAPLQRILDAGTGTGAWAMDAADLLPSAEVIGVDLSAIQPSFVPPNTAFIIDDLELEWDYPEPFDLVFGRMLVGSITDWPRFIQQSFNNLNSGGWIELQDIYLKPECSDGTLLEDSYIQKWSHSMLEATAKLGRFADSASSYKQQMLDAGFVNVTEIIYKWPTNAWPADAHHKELGRWTSHNIANELSGLSLALFTRALGLSREGVEVFLTNVRKEMKDRRVHAWWPVYVVYGQKP